MEPNRTLWLSVVGVAGLAASGASGQIAISEHNFSGTGWSQGQICLPCHTPHHAMEGMPRLWNHELTTATYTMHNQSYITPPIGSTGTAEANFDVASRMCLSCHDGTVALDSFGGTTGTSFIAAGNKANLGTNLEDDHPVGTGAMYPPPNPPSFWNTAFNPATGTGGSSVGSLRLKDLTWNGTNYKVVGCTTCHNPHNRGNYPHMTAISNNASALCLTCHIK